MKRIVIRSPIQTSVLVAVFLVFGLVGVTYFTNGSVITERNWFGMALGVGCILMGVVGVWRAMRLGTVVSTEGIRVRSFDSHDHLIAWHDVESIECMQVEERAGMPLFAPVIGLSDQNMLPITALGSYSRAAADRRVEQLRALAGPP